MNKAIVWVIVLLVILGGGWLLLSKNNGSAAPAAQSGPIKVGVILPLTGEGAAYGEPGRNLIQLGADKINAEGGVNGSQLQLVIEDGKCNGKDAASAGQKLVSVDKVQVIIGGFCSGESLAIEPITTAAKVLLFSPGSSNPGLTGISQFFARNYPSDSAQGVVLATVANEKGVKKMAVLQEQTDYSVGLFKSFDAKFTELGGTSIKEEFASGQSDLRSSLNKLKAAKPDALFVIVQTPASAERIFKQMSDIGWKPAMYISDVVPGFPDVLSKYKNLLEGAIAAEFTADANNAKLQEMLTAYKAKYGSEPPLLSYAQTEYDSIFIVADGLRAVGDNGEKLAQWIHTSVKDWAGAAGSVTIGSNGDPTTGHRPEVIHDGKVAPYTK